MSGRQHRRNERLKIKQTEEKCTCPKDISGKKSYFANWVPYTKTNGHPIICKKHRLELNKVYLPER